jgi:hypothetical protein
MHDASANAHEVAYDEDEVNEAADEEEFADANGPNPGNNRIALLNQAFIQVNN